MDSGDSEGLVHQDIEADRRAAQAAAPLAAAIVTEALGRSVQRVTPLIGQGAVNLILFVETDADEIIVRLNKPEDDADRARGEYEKERWCLERAASVGIPGPEALAVGEHAGRAYMLQRRIQGVNGKQSDVSPAELLRTLGRYARLFHALPVDGFGDSVAHFEGGGAREGWLRFVDYNLGELTDHDPLLALGVYTRVQQDAIRAAFTWLRGLPLRISLNHGDLARRNTIVGVDGRVYLLDWGCAETQVVPHYDLHALLHWYALDAPQLQGFLDGYGITEEAWAALLPEVHALALLKGFDLTRWAIDRCAPRIAEIAGRARRRLEVYLSGEGAVNVMPR